MITIWGRANSVNVQKVLWVCDELDLAFERIDAGLQYGRTRDPDYLAMNPNARVPTLVEGDFVLWESNSIMRYLALAHGGRERLYPEEPRLRCSVDRWLDWTLSTLQPAERPIFWGFVRTAPAERDMAAIGAAIEAAAELWRILDRHLDGRSFAEGERFTLADVALAAYARRWFGIAEIERPSMPSLEGWYRRTAERRGFERYLALPLT